MRVDDEVTIKEYIDTIIKEMGNHFKYVIGNIKLKISY